MEVLRAPGSSNQSLRANRITHYCGEEQRITSAPVDGTETVRLQGKALWVHAGSDPAPSDADADLSGRTMQHENVHQRNPPVSQRPARTYF
jgi:hypothetical protein